MKYLKMECDLCGEEKRCKWYKCYELCDTWYYLGVSSICDECLPTQEAVGPCIEEKGE